MLVRLACTEEQRHTMLDSDVQLSSGMRQLTRPGIGVFKEKSTGECELAGVAIFKVTSQEYRSQDYVSRRIISGVIRKHTKPQPLSCTFAR